MPERSERVLKIICLGLAAILVFELINAVFRHNPLEHAKIPSLPALTLAADAKTGGAGTNAVPARAAEKKGTNSTAAEVSGKPGTNSVSSLVTNKPGTNAVSAPEHAVAGTNSAPVLALVKSETNLVAAAEKKGTNGIVGTNVVAGTNLISGTNAMPGTNTASHLASARNAKNRNPRPGKKAADLPPVVQARIDKIVDSEILGPVIRPVPMGLLGIAGEYAFLRAPSGQTGLVKQGDELGGIKLLQVGINRVLVEEAGEKKELVIFDGFGSETLLPKQKEKPNETITKPK